MVFHIAAYHKAAASGTVLPLQPIQDDCITTAGNDLTVPELNNLVATLIFGGAPVQARLEAPSLRRILQEDIIRMINTETCVGAQDAIVDLREDPLVLVTAEKLNALTQHTTDGWCLVWLSDGSVMPAHGEIHTVRGTLAVTTTADIWENCALTLDQTLPAGRYQVVGFRMHGTNALAARLIFVGQAWRPGVPAGADKNTPTLRLFRKGRFGIFGEFEFDQPPQVEVLSTAATVGPQVVLDLIQVRAGR